VCGIAGFTAPAGMPPERRRADLGPRLRRMTASLRHRGPDAQTGLLLDGIALGHARLAIVDLTGGAQPMRDPATGVTIVYNGEVFNYVELAAELRSDRAFRTRSDTEVLLAAWIRWGPGCLDRLNGQFAFALWDPREHTLWLARDRMGILPLQYALVPGGIAFASEAKALVAGGFVEPALDGRGVKQAIQLWSPVPPRTCVAGVSQLPPGALARFADGRLEVRRWWDLDLGGPAEDVDAATAAERVGELLDDAVRLRLRADVPVGAYLSGGLDSAVLCALAQRRLGGTLHTYSIGFADPRFDETQFQLEVAGALETSHKPVLATTELVGELLPEAVRHAEQVLVRSAPAPLLRLSREVRAHGGKVVLTGEGSDEIFLGYDLYRETRVRSFWARRPASRMRPALLRRLYPYLPLGGQGEAVLRSVFGVGLEDPAAPGFSHLVRWGASGRVLRLLAPEFAAAVAAEDPVATAVDSMPEPVRRWRPMARAQWLEMHTLLAGNLLAPQGDRMLMASSVEGRFPFLDHRLVEYAARLPEGMKLRGLAGKWVLRRFAKARVPPPVIERPKFPYRAPAAAVLVGPAAPAWARTLLAPDAVRRAGVFDPDKVQKLVAKVSAGTGPVSEVDAMGVTAVATGQLLTHLLAQAAPSREHEEAVQVVTA
jgi:asparagine synthase (glutamine-hydrolysing)